MRIGLDGKVLNLRAGGIGRYAINLTRAILAEADARRQDLEFIIFTGPQTSRGAMEELRGRSTECYLGAKSSMLRSLALLPPALRRLGIDVFHGMDHVGIPFVGKTGKCVVTVHDVIPLMLPGTFTRRHRIVVRTALARVRRQADQIIVPSQAARRDVVQHLGVPGERVTVIPHGCEARFNARPEGAERRNLAAKYALPPRYLLAVGTLEPRKNLTTLLRAFARLRENAALDSAPGLVLAGARGWLDDPIFQVARSLGIEGSVRIPGFIDDADLPALYRGAELFAMPSVHEGFGLPLLEAMACGTPVVAANTAALAEVAGGAAVLVEPLDTEGMADAIVRVLRDEPLRLQLRDGGLQRAGQFSWQAAARATLDAYAALA